MEEIINLINVVITLCHEEKQNGYSGEATQEQIERYILPDMYALKKTLLTGEFPQKDYVESFANAFMGWNWDMFDATKLYCAITNLSHAYTAEYMRRKNCQE